MDVLNFASKFERYRFMPDDIPFLNNLDPECAKSFGFDPKLKTLAHFADKFS